MINHCRITSKTKLKLPSSSTTTTTTTATLPFEVDSSTTAIDSQIDRHHYHQVQESDTIMIAVDNNLTSSISHHDNVKHPCNENPHKEAEVVVVVSGVVKNHPSSHQVSSTINPTTMNTISSSTSSFHSIIITNISMSNVDNVVWRGTNDLYCIFELNGWEYHTSVREEAGDKASWDYIRQSDHHDDDDNDDDYNDYVKDCMNGRNGGLFMLPLISDITYNNNTTDDHQTSSSHHHHQNSSHNTNHHEVGQRDDDNDDDDFIHISNTNSNSNNNNKNNNKNVLTIKVYHKNLIVSDKLIGGVDVILSNYITSDLSTTDSIQIIENIYELSSSSPSSSSSSSSSSLLIIKQKVKSRGVITMSFLACHHSFNTNYGKSNHQYHSKLQDLMSTNHNYLSDPHQHHHHDSKLLSNTSSNWKKAERILDGTEQYSRSNTANSNNNTSTSNPINADIDDNNVNSNVRQNNNKNNNNNNNNYSNHNKIKNMNRKNIVRNNLKVNNDNNITTAVKDAGAAATTSIFSSSSIHTNTTVTSTTITTASKSALVLLPPTTAAATTKTATTNKKNNNIRLPYLYSVLQNVSMIKNNTDILRSKGNLVYDEAYRLSVKKISSFINLTIYEFATILYKLDVPVKHSLVFSSDKHQQQLLLRQQQQHYDDSNGDVERDDFTDNGHIHHHHRDNDTDNSNNDDDDDIKTFQLPLTHSMSLAATMSFIIEEHNMIDISRLKQSYRTKSSSSSSSSSASSLSLSFSIRNNNHFVLSEELSERALSYMVTLVEGSYSELRGIILNACEEEEERKDPKINNTYNNNNSLGKVMMIYL